MAAGNGNVVAFCVVCSVLMFGLGALAQWLFLSGRSDTSSSCARKTASETVKCKNIVGDFADIALEYFDGCSDDVWATQTEMVCPGSEAELEQLLQSDGIDTSTWGGNVATLQGQLKCGECWLVREDMTDQPGKLVRRLRVIQVRIAALFPTGLRLLKCTRSKSIIATGSLKFKCMEQNIAKKVDSQTCVEECIPGMISDVLHLPVDWQREHLRVVRRTAELLDSSSGERGTSFPGLLSQYWTDEVWTHITDVNAKGVAGKLLLPSGEGELEMLDPSKGKAFWFEWIEISGDDWETSQAAT